MSGLGEYFKYTIPNKLTWENGVQDMIRPKTSLHGHVYPLLETRKQWTLSYNKGFEMTQKR